MSARAFSRLGSGLLRGGKAAFGAVRPAIPTIAKVGAIGTAGYLGAGALGDFAGDVGESFATVEQAKNPPLQRADANPPEGGSTVFFDPRTGRTTVFGEEESSSPSGPEREIGETAQQAIKWGAIAAAGIAVVIAVTR